MSSASRSRTEVAHRLRAVLLDPEEAAGLDVHGRIDAAVLVPLYLKDGDLHAVFTRRRDDMRRHPGEISFPGGRQDDTDDDLVHTALREAEEEIGLPIDAVEVLEFPLHRLRAGYARRRLLRRGVPFRTDVYCVDEHLIWGATARIVADLLERVPEDLQ